MTHRPLTASRYDLWGDAAERAGLGRRRRRLLSQAHGTVLDLGAGDGYHLALYPPEVERVVVLEPDRLARARLEARVGEAAVPVAIRAVSVEELDAPPASFDTVISAFALCGVSDLADTLRRIKGWLRPGGILLFLEHVRAPGRRGRLQALAAPAWQLVVPGCHPDRDINAALWAAGMVVGACDRFVLPLANPIVGAAVEGVAQARLGPRGAASASNPEEDS